MSSQPTQGTSVVYQREPLLTRFVMTIPRALNNGFSYLSAVPGYKGVIAPLLAFGALSVGVETVYTVMPETSWSLPREERKFIPKLGVEDNPNIYRFIPVKAPLVGAVKIITPDFIDRRLPNAFTRTVWSDPAFYFAIIVCAAIQYQEAKLFKRKDYASVRAEALAANQTKRIKASPDALAIARTKVARHNAYGLGQETMSGAMILLLYGAEFTGFFFGFKGATSTMASVFWGLYTVFGYEVFIDRKN